METVPVDGPSFTRLWPLPAIAEEPRQPEDEFGEERDEHERPDHGPKEGQHVADEVLKRLPLLLASGP